MECQFCELDWQEGQICKMITDPISKDMIYVVRDHRPLNVYECYMIHKYFTEKGYDIDFHNTEHAYCILHRQEKKKLEKEIIINNMEEEIPKLAASAMFGPAGAENLRTGTNPSPKTLGLGWLLYGFTRMLLPEIVVEVGTGGSTMCILQGLKENGSGHLHTIDCFPTGSPDSDHGFPEQWIFGKDGKPVNHNYGIFLRQIRHFGYEDFVTFYYEKGEEKGKTWNKPIDILVVDAGHSLEETRDEWDYFSKWLKPGGYAFFHDPLACLEEIGILLQEKCGPDSEFSMMIEPNYLSMAIIQKKYTVDPEAFWFISRLTQTNNPQAASTPMQLTDARGVPGLISPWDRDYIQDFKEHFWPAREAAWAKAEKLIDSGKPQNRENMVKYLKRK